MKKLANMNKLLRWSFMVLALAISFCPVARAADPLKAEALLIWGTDDATSPNQKFAPVDDSLAKKLEKSPYRWKHFYEVSRQPLNVEASGVQSVKLSADCSVEITYLGNDRLEVKLFGKGKLVSTHKEPLPGKCVLIIGGASENETAWFVVIRRTGVSASPTPK